MLHALILSLVGITLILMETSSKASDSAVQSNQLNHNVQSTFEEGKKLAETMLRTSVQPESLKENILSQNKIGCPSQWQDQAIIQDKPNQKIDASKKEADVSLSSQILVFVSFSMPIQTLKDLSVEAEKSNAKLVIRGLIENSFKKTTEKLLGFQSALEINPNLFKEFDIQQVPTFVSLKDGKEVNRLAGNVSLTYAAEKLRGDA